MRRLIRTRTHDDRGVVVVEAVLVFPIIVFVCFAIIEYGMLSAAVSTTQSATRDGARFASANLAVAGSPQVAADAVRDVVGKDLSNRTGYDAPVQLLVYKADSNGNPTGTFTHCTADCWHYVWNGVAFVDAGNSHPWTNRNACINKTDASGNAIPLDNVGVYLEVRHSYVTGGFGAPNVMTEHTVTRLEPLPLSQCTG
jgi:hypothetical protein